MLKVHRIIANYMLLCGSKCWMLTKGHENGDGRNMFPSEQSQDTKWHKYKHKEHIQKKLE
jgi:hypothetical protein